MKATVCSRNKKNEEVTRTLRIDDQQTVLFVMDVWDRHWCKDVNEKAALQVPQINALVKNMRSRGVRIIHMPSDCMSFYDDIAQRRSMAELDTGGVSRWIYYGRRHNWLTSGRFPVFVGAENGCPCTPHCHNTPTWSRQHPGIEISEQDLISDNPKEVYTWLKQNGIKNILYCGFHANICILSRPMGIRKMRKLGFQCYLFRDHTDIMYDSRKWPQVSHEEGVERVISHIEKKYCPTMTLSGISK
ncbi:MAG: isochorismatase family protein [Bacteroidetes bacterium]|nr:isochorismatase family protein [Bacteroidota bacterium]